MTFKRVSMDVFRAGPAQLPLAEYKRIRKALSEQGRYEVGSGRTPLEWEAASALDALWQRVRWLERERGNR